MVNNHCEVFMNNNSGKCFTKIVENLPKLGLKVEETNIKFRLTTMKLLHVHWLVKFYNHITSASKLSIIINGWKTTCISDAIKLSSAE